MLPKCFTTEQSTVETSYLFYNKESNNFPMHSAEFSNQALFSKRVKMASAVLCSLIKRAKIAQSQSLLELVVSSAFERRTMLSKLAFKLIFK